MKQEAPRVKPPTKEKMMSETNLTPIVDKLLDDISADCEGAFWQEDATEDQVALIVEAARQLERDGYQTRMDAAHDAKRLIDDKMKFFERVTVLESDLADARAALREHVEAHTAQFPPAEAGIEAQNAWSQRRADATVNARAVLAKG